MYMGLSCSIIWSSGNVFEIICIVKNVKCVDDAVSSLLIPRV